VRVTGFALNKQTLTLRKEEHAVGANVLRYPDAAGGGWPQAADDA
jgi:hypothetical protein